MTEEEYPMPTGEETPMTVAEYLAKYGDKVPQMFGRPVLGHEVCKRLISPLLPGDEDL